MSLRIGILECDHVDHDLQDQYGDYHEMFADLLLAHDSSIEFTVYDLIADDFPNDINLCDAYIITGSRFGVYEDIPWIHKSKELINTLYEADIPTIGICFGHQLIAESLGGKVIKADDKGRGLGVLTWDIKSKVPSLANDPTSSLSLNACHQDQVIKLPDNSETILSSDFCPIAAFKKDSMLGIQGHPEFNTPYTQYLFEKYNETLDDEAQQHCIDSFNIQANSASVGAWMLDFIQSELN